MVKRDTGPNSKQRQVSGKVNPAFKDAFFPRMFAKVVANLRCRPATSWDKDGRNWSPKSTWGVGPDRYVYNCVYTKYRSTPGYRNASPQIQSEWK